MSFLSQMAQDEGGIPDSKLTDAITWFQTLPDWGKEMFDQNPWLFGGAAALVVMTLLMRSAKKR